MCLYMFKVLNTGLKLDYYADLNLRKKFEYQTQMFYSEATNQEI